MGRPSQGSRTAIVTGAASGIGRGIAHRLGRDGWSLVLADLEVDGLATVARELADLGAPACTVVVGDQSDPKVAERTADAAVRDHGGLDGVVCNAGVGVTGMLDEIDAADWVRAFRVNVDTAFLLTRESLRVMKRAKRGGSIVFIASKSAFGPSAGFGAYSASKAAMVQLMRVAALEGGPHQIRVNAINPGAVFAGSRVWEQGVREARAAALGVNPQALESFYADRTALGRSVRPEDVAASVAFLLSADSALVTGGVINVDGGVAAAFPR
ncbi:MAG: SDR family oxidoreductase [Pseudolysinimonas sp.]|uniref:SDR family oxidoreductase n=1 Tax=Pseudolysinimonas sp. TaxID=2680009 RepID=UPI003C784357